MSTHRRAGLIARAAQRPISLTDWAFLVGAVLLVQLLIARLGLPPDGRLLVGDEHMYVALAKDWAAGGEKPIDPFWPPGYSWLFARWIRAFGSEVSFLLPQIAALLVATFAVGRLTFFVSRDRAISLLAAALVGCSPQLASFAQYYWPEALHLAIALVLCEVALLRRPSVWTSLGFAALAAAALLLKSLLTPLLPILVVAQAVRAVPGRRLLVGLLSGALTLALLAPVIAANYRKHGLLAVADSTTFNLILGLTETSRRSLAERTPRDLQIEYLKSAAEVAQRRAWLDRRLADLLSRLEPRRQLGEQVTRQYFRLFDRESVFSAMLPGGSLHARGRGYRAPPELLWRALIGLDLALYALMLAAAPWGLALLLQHERAAGLWLAGWIAYLLAIFLVLHVDVRYRAVLLPVLAIATAVALSALLRRKTRLSERPLPPAGRWSALAASGLLLYLGFALP